MRENALTHLRTALGRADAEFRPGQWESIEAILNRQRVFVVERTGWGWRRLLVSAYSRLLFMNLCRCAPPAVRSPWRAFLLLSCSPRGEGNTAKKIWRGQGQSRLALMATAPGPGPLDFRGFTNYSMD
jgi:hypothetical protein